MYAIVNIAGKQMKVMPDVALYTPQLNQKVGDLVTFDQVLLIRDDKGTQVGAPTIAGAKVQAKVQAHVKGHKIIVFKKKRRKGFKKKQGHRQGYTKITIQNIINP